MLIDITKALSEKTEIYPGDPAFSIKKVFSIEKNGFNLHKISMGSHTGTHIDFPLHFIEGGADISEFPSDLFITSAIIVDASITERIDSNFLKNKSIIGFESLIFKTNGKNVYLTSDGAEFIVSQGISLIGTELLDIENEEETGFNVHKTLLSNNIPIIENLFLENVSEGLYRLYCFPLKIENCDASPIRAVLEK